MFCPECGAEYRDGFYECSDCQVSLVEEPAPKAKPTQASPPPVELVTVLASGDSFLIGAAKSLLDQAGIRYVAKGEGLQDLFAAGRLGVGFSPIAGPVELQVEPECKQDATDLLAQLRMPESKDNAESEREAIEPQIAASDSLAVSARAKLSFRVLVLADLALLWITFKLGESFNETLPQPVIAYLNSLYRSDSLARIAYDLYCVMLVISTAASLGLLMFSRLARQVYLLSWLLWLPITAFMGGSISNGLVTLCSNLETLMSGAIIALTFFSPIEAAFTKHDSPITPSE